MNSKEALDVIAGKHCTQKDGAEDGELKECYGTVMRDLDILGILKGAIEGKRYFTVVRHEADGEETYEIVTDFRECFPDRIKLTKKEYDEVMEWFME